MTNKTGCVSISYSFCYLFLFFYCQRTLECDSVTTRLLRVGTPSDQQIWCDREWGQILVTVTRCNLLAHPPPGTFIYRVSTMYCTYVTGDTHTPSI